MLSNRIQNNLMKTGKFCLFLEISHGEISLGKVKDASLQN